MAGRKLVFGIGNPGLRYRNTRHNVGFMVVDELAGRLGVRVRGKIQGAMVGKGLLEGGGAIVLAKPMTYVNLCGGAYKRLLDEFDVSLEDGLVVCDDIALPLGRLRLRRKGSSGGHNGLESIGGETGTTEFPRLRVGIGDGEEDRIGFVLSPFRRAEREKIKAAVSRAAEAAMAWAERGVDEAMNLYNRKEEETEGQS